MLKTDVLAMEIAMALPNVAVLLSLGELAFAVLQEFPRILHEGLQRLSVGGHGGEGFDLGEIFFRGGRYGFDASEFSAPVRRDMAMKHGKGFAYVLQGTEKGPPFTDQLEEKAIKGNPLHADRVFHGPTIRLQVETVCSMAPVYGLDTEVNALRKPRIEDYLLFAKKTPPPEGAEIEKTKVYRLLDLVDEGIADEHVGYGSLHG